MADTSQIEWTDATWSPVTGCTKVSAGCKHCYAEREVEGRWSKNPKSVFFGRAFTDVQRHEAALEQPLRWKKPKRIFVCPRADLFHEAVPDEFLDQVFGTMAAAPQHTFQVLTKRTERMQAYLSSFSAECSVRDYVKYDPAAETMAWPLRNVWVGTSIEDARSADERIPWLLRTPAAVRWLSAEPLLGPIDLRIYLPPMQGRGWVSPYRPCGYDGTPLLHWIVAGGESGHSARPMHPAWARSLRDQCQRAGVPFLFKQWGEWVPRSSCYHTFEDGRSCADIDPSCKKWPVTTRMTESGGDGTRLDDVDGGDDAYMQRVGVRDAGRLLDGALHDGYPE